MTVDELYQIKERFIELDLDNSLLLVICVYVHMCESLCVCVCVCVYGQLSVSGLCSCFEKREVSVFELVLEDSMFNNTLYTTISE